MKKSKLSLCLASSFVAALSLAACSSVSGNDSAIVEIKNYDGSTVPVLTSAIYNKYKENSDGISKFYNAILESIIRYEYDNPQSGVKNAQWTKAIKSLAEIKTEAENNVKNDKTTADENAKSNNTSYDTEWKAILDSHNCKDENELFQYYVYQLEKADITDKYFILNQKDSALTTEYIGVKDNGEASNSNVKGVFPMHVRHVLVSITSGATDFFNSTITNGEAKSLGNTIEALTDSKYTFADVAKKFSGDTGSAAKGGDVGIMSTTTSFVNEFKLGLYAFETIYNKTNAANSAISKGLGLDEENNYKFSLKGINADGSTKDEEATEGNAFNFFSSKLKAGKIQTVPYAAFTKIAEYAEDTTDKDGKQVNDGNENYYPRNILWNYYLNFHNPFVILNQKIDETTGFPTSEEATSNGHWITFEGVKVLADEAGHPIIGVRSEHGIHLMILEKSIYEFNDGKDDNVSLEQYYTSYVPSDTANYPKDSKGNDKNTYVNFIQTTDTAIYTERATEVKNAVKSFDSTYDYRLFNYLLALEANKVVIKDETLKGKINDYISQTRSTNNVNADKTLNEAWRTYAELIALQYDSRTVYTDAQTLLDDGQKATTIHPRCAVGFKNHSGSEWTEAKGVCHYEK